MSYSRATATATLLFILATTGVPARSLPWETEGLGHLQQKRETDGLRPHEEETNRLITQLDDLATNLVSNYTPREDAQRPPLRPRKPRYRHVHETIAWVQRYFNGFPRFAARETGQHAEYHHRLAGS